MFAVESTRPPICPPCCLCAACRSRRRVTLRWRAQEAEPKLPNLLKLLVWAQKQLDEKATYPRIENLVTAELVEPPPADD